MLRLSPALRVGSAVGLLAALCVGATPSLGAGSHTSATTETVTASEFKFKLSKSRVPRGKVVFTVRNTGKLAHDFWINGKKTPRVSPGRTAKLTVTLKAGKFPYLCTVPGHASAGMKGTLTVT